MTNLDVRIDRLRLVLHGVSSEIVESAISGLDSSLARRLGSTHFRDVINLDIAELALPPADAPRNPDAAVLRGLIVDGLIEAVVKQSRASRS